MTDEELVERANGGATDAFNQLVVRWERPIHALAYRVLGREEDASDVYQEAFMRAFRGLKGFKGQAKFSSWLYRIAQNLCRDWLRLERRVGLMPPRTLKLRIRGRDLAAIRTGQLSAEEARKLVETP